MKIKIAFFKGKGDNPFYWLLNTAIRIWTLGKYSHCEIYVSEEDKAGLFTTTTYIASGIKYRGVVKLKNKVYLSKDWDLMTVKDGGKAKEIKAFLDSKVGSKYDWLGIFFSQFFRTEIHSPDRWFCSEYCAAALKRSGVLNTTKPAQSVHPNRMKKILKNAGLLS